MTGRAAGYCAGFAAPEFVNAPGGRGFGRRGGGRGRRNWFYATGLTGWQRAASGQSAFGSYQPQAGLSRGTAAPASVDPQQEIALLKQQAESLGDALAEVQRRLDELQTQPEQEAQPQ